MKDHAMFLHEEYPKIEFEGKDYFITGCSMCEENLWLIASDGKDFVARCVNCNHIVKLKTEILRDKPHQKAIDSRFFS